MQKNTVEIPVMVQRGFECRAVTVNEAPAIREDPPIFPGDMDSWIERWNVELADNCGPLDIRIHIQRATSSS